MHVYTHTHCFHILNNKLLNVAVYEAVTLPFTRKTVFQGLNIRA